MNGWFKAPRKIVQEDFFGNAKAVQVYFYLAAMASIKEREITINGNTITLKPGEIAIGRKVIAMACNMAESTVENILKKLTKNKIIGHKTFSKYRLISILCDDCEEEVGHIIGHKTDASLTQVGRKLDTSSDASSTQNGHYIRKKKEDSKERKKNKEVNTPLTPRGDGELETGDVSNYPTDADYYYEIGLTGNGCEKETPQNTIGGDLTNENGTDDTLIPTGKKKTVKTKKNEDTKTHTEIIKLYSDWMESRNLPARIDASDAAAVKKIVSYLSKFEKVQSGERTVVDLLKYVLDNWNSLPGWNQNQTQLRQINSQLPTIIEMIKNKSNGTATSKQNDHYNELDRLSKTIRENLTNGYGL